MGSSLEWRIDRADRTDALIALGLAGFTLLLAQAAPAGTTDLDLLGNALLSASGLVLAVRRRAPVAVLLLSMACVIAYQVQGYPDVPPIPILVAIYTAVRARRRLVVIVVAGIGLILSTLAVNHAGIPGRSTREIIQGSILVAGWLVAAGVLAEVSRHRQAYLEQVEERAAEAERSREETARRRAGEERLRIARELHDSLTHSISIIKVQAGVAVHLARKRGEEVPDALLAIQAASGDAVRELRATLTLLRRPGDGAGDESPDGVLDRLPELVEGARVGGLPASVTVTGDQRALPPEVERAAYRIVQEALTNVSRHAGPASASVHIGYDADRLTVQVDDDGRASPGAAPVPGIGLIGMRERVTALGGRLRAEPRPKGGFTVRAELPLPDAMGRHEDAT